MDRYVHQAGTIYRIMEGVRRAKAAQLFGHTEIRAEVVDPSGQSFGEGEIPIDSLRSPKEKIRP